MTDNISDQRVFQLVLEEAVRSKINVASAKGREWLRTRAQNFEVISEVDFMKQHEEKLTDRPRLGSLYMYFYKAKFEQKLPYYDQFPCAFPVEWVPGGFTGINIHYLPPLQRGRLLDDLYKLRTDPSMSEQTVLQLSYQILSNTQKYVGYRSCYRRYLWEGVQSKFLAVNATEWDIATFIPAARFVGASENTVYQNSLGQLKKISGKVSKRGRL